MNYLVNRLTSRGGYSQYINDAIEAKLSNDLVRLAVIENQLKVITWILYAVAGGVITMLIKILFGG